MGYGKWIGGVVGFMAMGPLGALAGYAIGALFDKATDAEAQGATGREYYGPTSSGHWAAQQFPFRHACHGFVHYPSRRAYHAQRDGVCAPFSAGELW